MFRYRLPTFSSMTVLSLCVLVLFNHYVAFGWSADASLSMAKSSSLGLEDLHQSLGGDSMRRRLQQIVPAPAPGPASAATGGGGYIGYGVLSAGYVPCPPQSGRSYYTPNCESSSAPINSYTRGCSTITLCART